MPNTIKILLLIIFTKEGRIESATSECALKGGAGELAARIGSEIDSGKTVQLQVKRDIIHTISKSDGKLHFDTIDMTDIFPKTLGLSPEYQEKHLLDFCMEVIL